MNNLQALGHFMDYCNRNTGETWINQEFFSKGCMVINLSPEGSFSDCMNGKQVAEKLKHYNRNATSKEATE